MMKPTQQQREAARAAFVQAHGARVRRATAMKLLGIEDGRTFKKVVDVNPGIVHKLKGEGQPKYLTAEIFGLLPVSAWCATGGQESN